MQTPAGGHRDVQWVIQYRKVKAEDQEIPQEELLWTRLEGQESEDLLSGPKVRSTLKLLRENTFGLEWRAIRIETVQRVEGW